MIQGPTSHSFISQRLRLHYAEWGAPDSPPLVLLHGGRDHCRSWDWLAQDLCRDWRIIAPDLRGHGDSAWAPDGNYAMAAYIYDFAQLFHQLKLAPCPVVAHSLGGNVALRYAGLYPENISKLIAIEGLGPSPKLIEEAAKVPLQQRWRQWIDDKRAAAGRTPRRYPSIEAALARMKEENGYLSDDQARHLTIHGVTQNEDGTYTWKFDPYLRIWGQPVDLTAEQIAALWQAIICPTLLCYGADSWASNPDTDGRARHFRNARVVTFAKAGHWPHHDQFERFLAETKAFLAIA